MYLYLYRVLAIMRGYEACAGKSKTLKGPGSDPAASVAIDEAEETMSDADLTIAAVHAKGWEVVRLRGKKPVGPHWQITTDSDEIAAWLAAGNNIGLVCHERTRIAVLDPDDLVAWADMIDALGQPSTPWVITGSGRLHYYLRWEPDLPAKLTWQGKTIGEIQRGPGQQQVVLPPSVHPTTALPYHWISESLSFLCEPTDPVSDPLPELPGLWRAYLRHQVYASSRR